MMFKVLVLAVKRTQSFRCFLGTFLRDCTRSNGFWRSSHSGWHRCRLFGLRRRFAESGLISALPLAEFVRFNHGFHREKRLAEKWKNSQQSKAIPPTMSVYHVYHVYHVYDVCLLMKLPFFAIENEEKNPHWTTAPLLLRILCKPASPWYSKNVTFS